ncbi:D-2-hydroxyacid dehydrogenase [Microvirga antarctica]|uniref:D-2-hydroxyacid dehydrogenase n=1 Tax=Microvirga antarctica TaxID=2819233 RepID=UPI001B30B5F8|nr:D-2-hydroxyacid dehydrogenase [Microvirga antarctica]
MALLSLEAGRPLRILAYVQHGYEFIERHCGALDGVHLFKVASIAKLAASIGDADAIILSASAYSAEVAQLACESRRLRWIQCASIGYDPFLAHGVPKGAIVTNAAGVWNSTVAEHAMTLLLALNRQIPQMERNRLGRLYDRNEVFGRLRSVEGQTLLIIGYGSIGMQVAKRASAFGMHIIAVTKSGCAVGGIETVGVESLRNQIPKADAVVLSLPLSSQSRHVFGAPEFALMRRAAILINVSRGEIVDQGALVRALQSGSIAGAGLDVFDPEPIPTNSSLWDLSNVIITPRVAGYAPPAFAKLGQLVGENLRRFRSNECLLNRVLGETLCPC